MQIVLWLSDILPLFQNIVHLNYIPEQNDTMCILSKLYRKWKNVRPEEERKEENERLLRWKKKKIKKEEIYTLFSLYTSFHHNIETS